jgi:hypothetical protein
VETNKIIPPRVEALRYVTKRGRKTKQKVSNKKQLQSITHHMIRERVTQDAQTCYLLLNTQTHQTKHLLNLPMNADTFPSPIKSRRPGAKPGRGGAAVVVVKKTKHHYQLGAKKRRLCKHSRKRKSTAFLTLCRGLSRARSTIIWDIE